MQNGKSAYTAWMGVGLLVVCTFVSYWNIFLLSPLQPFIAADLDISIGQAAQLTSVSAGASIVSLIAFGIFGSRFSRKVIIVAGMVSLTIGSFLLTLTDSYTLMLLIRVLNGFSDGLIYPAAAVLIYEYLKEEEREKGIVLILAGTGLSAVVGIPITIELLNTQDWQSSFELFTWVSVAGILASFILPGSARVEENPGKGLEVFLTNNRLRAIATANITGDIAWFGALTFLGSFLVHSYDPGLDELALFYFVAGLSFVVASFLGASPNFQTQKQVAIGSSLTSAILAPIFFSVSEGYVYTLVFAVAYAFCRAPGIATMDNMLLSAAKSTTTRVVSAALSSIISGVAVLVAASIGGVVLDSTAYTVIGAVFGISAFASVIFLWRLQPIPDSRENQKLVVEPSLS